jgi:hypothetical protein
LKRRPEILPAALTDHSAVVLRISPEVPYMARGKGLWKLNNHVLYAEELTARFVLEWKRWKATQHRYIRITPWWNKHAKRRTSAFFEGEGARLARDDRLQENFLYTSIYDVLRVQEPIHNKTLKLKQIKGKITRIHSKTVQVLQTDVDVSQRITGEQPSMYNLLQTHSRRQRRVITEITDRYGILHNTAHGSMEAFV